MNAEYCHEYQAILSRLAYFGLLNDKDAVCFNASSTILDGSYLLTAGAILLALLNTFVTKAVYQYFRDKQDETTHVPTNTPVSAEDKGEVYKENGDTDKEKGGVDPEILESIQPVPVLFTDIFRWVLRPERTIEVDCNNPQIPQSGLFSDYAPSQRTVIVPKEKSSSLLDNIVAETNPEKDPDWSQRIFKVSTFVPVQINASNRSSSNVSDLDDDSRVVKPKGGDILVVDIDTPDKTVEERKVRSYREDDMGEWTSDDDSEEEEEKQPNLGAWTSGDDSWTSDDDDPPGKEQEQDVQGDEALTNSQSKDNVDDWTSDEDSIDEDNLFV
jgi:hypothetical protein